MPRDLQRYQESGQSHFFTFSCYRRQAFFNDATRFELFVRCLEEMRRRYGLCVYAYVVMPEHGHGPDRTDATRIQTAKLPQD